jgi:hypothetical protein
MNDQRTEKLINEISQQVTEIQKSMVEINERLTKERSVIGNGIAYKVVEKVDMLNDSMQKLIVLEERQLNFTNRLEHIKNHTVDIDKKINDFEIKFDRLHTLESRSDLIAKDLNGLGHKVEKYINIGKGAWITIAAAWAIIGGILGFLIKP